MNGITKEAFLKAKGTLKDELLYDMLASLYKQVSFKRTLIIAFLGAVIAITIAESPSIASALYLLW